MQDQSRDFFLINKGSIKVKTEKPFFLWTVHIELVKNFWTLSNNYNYAPFFILDVTNKTCNIGVMKSAYELAMERLAKESPIDSVTDEQKSNR